MLILLSDIMQLSVGTLFAAAVLPGLMLAGLYCAWIAAIGILRPEHGAGDAEGRARHPEPRRQLWLRVFKVALPPLGLVLSVLGSIIAGIAAPTEAASMGALGSILVVAFAAPALARRCCASHALDPAHLGDGALHPDLRAGVQRWPFAACTASS